ncbi:protein WEAK CHLOROPLAST MOVEMENT UNDER BLUE LIGHT 1-like [Oryza brachyantha]|uniref:Protein WEAK CHLOROPLAST MOVEMENT UNDER BLUE LIGHT 1 n=1 Tax=Oryza brachyantha TaxID=4533 RepID=J3MN11_ORYBR|nr:protein WEAK CHLOROPLAST MOVEMENT UNDER BLUE LIGHT 1-like [Oryza brachyantha]XP_015695297.1 protein WEAK CHLOROPLAST MOVEMENT UNDER BLUE LIGHT 1-like [Oryza brachyantha]
MELTCSSEESNSKESSVNPSSSSIESSGTFVDHPTPPTTKEVDDSSDHEKTNAQEEKSAQPAILKFSNGLTDRIGCMDSPSPVIEMPLPDSAEHHMESNSPTAEVPEIHSGLSEAFKHSIEDEADNSSSVDAAEVNHLSDSASAGSETMSTDEMSSKEDWIDQTNAAAKPKPIEEQGATPESPYKGLIDTTAPFESVREVVTKFGGIVDWKAHKAQMMERRKFIQLELEKVQKEIPLYKEELEAAEMVKSHVVNELEETRRIIEELKHNLEKAQIEEVQAKQDSELAVLRAQEIEQGIADEASVIARTQIEVAKERHEKAITELNSVKKELKAVHEQYVTLVNERDTAIRRSEEVISAGKDIEKRVEELTLELIASKGSLELAHAAHHEAEERRIGAALAKEQDCVAWDRELQQAQEELQQHNNKLLSKSDVKLNLDANLCKLRSLKSELAAYVQNVLSEEAEGLAKEHGSDDARQISGPLKEALASTQKELEEVRANIEKAKNEAKLFRLAAATLRSEMENQKSSLVALQEREGMASIAITALEAELNRTKQEIECVRSKEADAQERMVELPRILQEATQEAEDAKMVAFSVQEQVRKARQQAEKTKTAAATVNTRLGAVLKEIDASRVSEKIALAAVQALQESEETGDDEDSPRGVSLPLTEYYALSKKAHEAEHLAHESVTAALAQVELAKASESNSLERLCEASKKMNEKKDALERALQRAERANEGKLNAEQELRKWRADHEQRRKAHEAARHAVNPLSSSPRRFAEEKDPFHKVSVHSYEDLVPNRKLRRKKSFFPLMGSLLSRKT